MYVRIRRSMAGGFLVTDTMMLRRYPVDPLIECAAARWTDDRENEFHIIERETKAMQVLGLPRNTAWKWKKNGGLIGSDRADRLAVRLGLHPCFIWPNWFDAFDASI